MEFHVQIISHCPAFKNSFFALSLFQVIQSVVEVIQTVIFSVLWCCRSYPDCSILSPVGCQEQLCLRDRENLVFKARL